MTMDDDWYFDDDDDDDDSNNVSAMTHMSPPISQFRDKRYISLFISQFDWLSAKESE